MDFDFYGHQIVAHLSPGLRTAEAGNLVDGDDVPVPHFGIILDMHEWQQLARRLSSAGVRFIIEPRIRFRGQPGEQATMFLLDPCGNALEFKAFADSRQVFAR